MLGALHRIHVRPDLGWRIWPRKTFMGCDCDKLQSCPSGQSVTLHLKNMQLRLQGVIIEIDPEHHRNLIRPDDVLRQVRGA